ncbi:MAG: dienelactone hydrolase family protein, partial [Anaerolineae bacterium]|nr:dienelactone hydrolase family protein [Anaerolineae bacterium]
MRKRMTAWVVIQTRTKKGDGIMAEQVTDLTFPGLYAQDVDYAGETGRVRAYLARLEGKTKRPGVIVIHENRGLQPHIKDVTRRMAREGFLALAPDALSPLGGTPEDDDQARTLIQQLDPEATIKNFVAAVRYLQTHPLSTGKVGCTG